jgi:alpha-methylacyl-CoA racemase
LGPLAGLKIIEFATVGPAPMCAMLLADLGATVLRIDRAVPVELGSKRPLRFDLLQRGRQLLTLDLKSDEGVALALELVSGADALIEGFRPGVMERLGLGPEICLANNPKLVYGRMTGWGQTGPLADAAAHDLNFIALTGALDAIGQFGQAPSIPLNLLGDFAGGSLYLALGILAALQETGRSGRGQVVDAAIVDGVMSLMTSLYGSLAAGMWQLQRGSNLQDSGAPFYNVYECADGKWVSIAPVEKRFFQELLKRIGIDEAEIPDRMDRSSWPHAHQLFAAKFKTRKREEWCALLEGSDACFAPVLSMAEVSSHPHMAERGVLVDVGGVRQPASAPRFSRTKPEMPAAPRPATRDEALASLHEWVGAARYAQLQASGTLNAVRGSVLENDD